jgi:hypothetical protein
LNRRPNHTLGIFLHRTSKGFPLVMGVFRMHGSVVIADDTPTELLEKIGIG